MSHHHPSADVCTILKRGSEQQGEHETTKIKTCFEVAELIKSKMYILINELNTKNFAELSKFGKN